MIDYSPTMADASPFFKEVFYKNKALVAAKDALSALPYSLPDVLEAEDRLKRFAPLIMRLFPETEVSRGIIESELRPIEQLKANILREYPAENPLGSLYIKLDSLLPIAGSVKARGGIYEVLKHTEALALENGLLESGDTASLADRRDFFSRYTIQVGSTGNLGLSIGISASAIGYKTVVHMSADAKEWKKRLLRSCGVTVIEYESDYSEAVKRGRALSDSDPMSYFIDDENSLDLFMGYAVAALRLKNQLDAACIAVNHEHPLFVYLPCGVGGAPGGITFALKLLFGDNVHCFFIEPVNAPCMLAALSSGECRHIEELGLSGKTDADGLAVGAASRLVYSSIKELIDGEFTVSDERLKPLVKLLYDEEGIFIEPSAVTSLAGYIGFIKNRSIAESLSLDGDSLAGAAHILWATGGGLVPTEQRQLYTE